MSLSNQNERCDVSGEGDVDNLFLDKVELTDGVKAESMYYSMMKSQHKAGIDDEDASHKHNH